MSLPMISLALAANCRSNAKLILTVLANCHNAQTQRCDPSTARLMQITGLSDRSVSTALLALENGGHLTVHRRHGARSSYTLHPQPAKNVHPLAPETTEDSSPPNLVPPPKILLKPPKILLNTTEDSSQTTEDSSDETGRTGKETEEPERKRLAVETKRFGKAEASKNQRLTTDFAQAAAVPIPPSLQTPAFATAWEQWGIWRQRCAIHSTPKGAKPPWTAHAARRVLAKCEHWGPARAVAAILHSLDRWEDIYEPHPESPNNNGHSPTHFHPSSAPVGGSVNVGRYARKPTSADPTYTFS